MPEDQVLDIHRTGRIPSYPKVYNLGHPGVEDLFREEVVIEEKVDGSQFSFASLGGVLTMRSKGADVFIDTAQKLFAPAVETAAYLFGTGKLTPEWIYRGEAFCSPKHNTISYKRMPEGGFVLYDIETGPSAFMDPEAKAKEAERLWIEIVPCFEIRKVGSLDDVMSLMEKESFLGGSKVEGIVFKNYLRYGRDGKVQMGKYVSEAFKEQNSSDFRKRNPAKKDIIELLGQEFRTPARWEKAVQHMLEDGELLREPKDIGPLMKYLHKDLEEEAGPIVAQRLLKWAMPQVKRRACAGFAEWYKEKLAALQFPADEPCSEAKEAAILQEQAESAQIGRGEDC